MSDEEISSKNNFILPVEYAKQEDYVPYKSLDDFKNRNAGKLANWALIFPEQERENLIKEELMTYLKNRENPTPEDEEKSRLWVEEETNRRMEHYKEREKKARENLLDAEHMSIESKGAWSPDSFLQFVFHENDLKKNGGTRDYATASVSLSELIAALHLPEDELLDVVNQSQNYNPNFGRDGFFQTLANKTGKKVHGYNAGAQMEYLPK